MNEKAEKLLAALGGDRIPDQQTFRDLVTAIDSHQVLAKVFILEGTPYVFEKSPMKYVIFREQVAERFGVGSQDVCIVGSAKLGFSPSARKFGKKFEETSDVDVVVISDELFDSGSRELFAHVNSLKPNSNEIRDFQHCNGGADSIIKCNTQPGESKVPLENWRAAKDAIRNFVFQNFNPGLLPYNNHLRSEIFNKISSTAGLFLALEPKVFVSKIRCRIFRTWKAAEAYYANSLRELGQSLDGESVDISEDDETLGASPGQVNA